MKRILFALMLLGVGCGGKRQGADAPPCGPLGDMGCFYPTTAPATRTPCGEVTEHCDRQGVTTPRLGCQAKEAPSPGTVPARVTLTGFVHAFADGPDTGELQVQLFDAAALANGTDPRMVSPIGSTTAVVSWGSARACDADQALGCVLPRAGGCAVPCDDGGPVAADQPSGARRPDRHQYCRADGGGGQCRPRARWEARYTLPNIPTNQPLVARISGTNSQSSASWATTVSFNVLLSTQAAACRDEDDRDCLDLRVPTAPRYQLDVAVLAVADYQRLPIAAGLSSGITAGEGLLLGEVRDCDEVRVDNVQIAVSPAADRLTYFNGDPVQAVPDSRRATLGTDRLGRFAALNLRPGKVEIATAGLLAPGQPLTSFGTIEAFAYPNSVSVVTLPPHRAPPTP